VKVNGKKLSGVARREVHLPRPDGEDLVLTVEALPLGYEEKVAAELPAPRAPRKLVQRNGRWVKGADGRPLHEVDEGDPDYLAAARRVARLQAVAFLVRGLAADPSVEWEADPELRDRDTEGYYETIHGELQEAGLTTGDVKALLDAILELSGARAEAVEEAREAFLPEAPLR